MKYIATVKDKRLGFTQDFVDWVKDEKNQGKKVLIDTGYGTRTMNQNNFYWFYLGLIEAETGNLADDIHEYAKRKFLPPRFIKVKGEEIRIPGSTTKLTKLEFGEYMDKLSAWSEVEIPNPEDFGFIKSK